jgi:Asp/Glu/hydantoin racemase
MKIQTGQAFYGQDIGVIVFENTAPRIPGDAGHAASFGYPVRFEIVKGNFSKLLDYDEEVRQDLLNACHKLKRLGIRGIISDCGMMGLYQDSFGAELGIPFLGSSLCQIPMVWQMIGRGGSIGILTGHSDLLSEKHLRASGWTSDIKLSIQGLQDESHFNEIVIKGGHNLNPDRMNMDICNAARKLMNKTPDLRAIIMECSNIGSFSRNVSDLSGLPVFDTISAANLLAYSLRPPIYSIC